MKMLLLGNTGQLGWELERTLAPLGDLVSLDYPQIDLTKPEQIRNVILQTRPQILINATAYTAVEKAEKESDLAMAINGVAPGILSEESQRTGAAIIHYSTDFVFNGEKSIAYVEEDNPDPVNVYGVTKLAGEKAVEQASDAYLTLRTSWVYSVRRDNFLLKVLQWSRNQKVMRVVDDQIGSPTWSRMLAEVTSHLLAAGKNDPVGYIKENKGIYHLAGNGSTSRYEFAKAILKYDPKSNEQMCSELTPAKTSDFPSPVKRPQYSALDCSKFIKVFGLKLPEWEDTLRLALS